MKKTSPAEALTPTATSSLPERIRALPEGEALEEITAFLRAEIAAVAEMGPEPVFDNDEPLIGLGLTSLMATELHVRVQRGLKVELPLTQQRPLDMESVDTLGPWLLRLVMNPPAPKAAKKRVA